MKVVEQNEGIIIYDDVYEAGYCEHIISQFNILENEGVGRSRVGDAPDHMKKDWAIFGDAVVDTDNHSLAPFNGKHVRGIYFDGLQTCYDHYADVFSVLRNNGRISCKTMKIQKTVPGGGYHVFHYEQGPDEQSKRVITFILYLNSLPTECGGETEFLYQKKRYSPVANRLIMFPAAFTHTHRGNMVLDGEPKYIITGWFCYD